MIWSILFSTTNDLFIPEGYGDTLLQKNDSSIHTYHVNMFLLCYVIKYEYSKLMFYWIFIYHVAYRNQRDTNFFEIIAATTGGRVYDTNKEDIGNVLDEVIEVFWDDDDVY